MSETRLPENRRIHTPKPAPSPSSLPEPTHDAPWADYAVLARRALQVGLSVLVLAGGGAMAVGARHWVTHSTRFGLRDLTVTGNRHFTSDEIAARAGIALGQNVVALDLEGARRRLEGEPWIERARLTRRLPGTVLVDVVERTAAAVVLLPSGAYLATETGELFKRLDVGDPGDLPVVSGIHLEDAARDRDATAQLVRRALDLALEIERAQIFGGRVEELAVDDQGGVTAVLGKRGLRVAFGVGGFRAKVRTAQRLEAELTRRGARPTVIFLDDDQHPERVVVRLVSALPPASVVVDDDPRRARPGNSVDGAAQRAAAARSNPKPGASPRGKPPHGRGT